MDNTVVRIVAATVQTMYDLAVDIDPAVPYPESARMPATDQYHAGDLIHFLTQGLHDCEKRIGVADRDISLPFLAYVYGEAQVDGNAAVVSTFRLIPADLSPPDKSYTILYERIAKVTAHETGHLMGVLHCRNPGCIMNFSMGLKQLDCLDPLLCRQCHALLQHD